MNIIKVTIKQPDSNIPEFRHSSHSDARSAWSEVTRLEALGYECKVTDRYGLVPDLRVREAVTL